MKLIKKITLKSSYLIYVDSEDNYKLVKKNDRGEEYNKSIPLSVAEYVQRKFRHQCVTVAQTKELLAAAPKRLMIPYDDGWQLGFYAQSALLVLVAIGRATCVKNGRRFDYTISPTPKLQAETATKGKKRETV